MTTIPIEVIIQDAESPVTPTPTPESGEETNITVPDTGIISDVGSNSGGIGSSASIILPAIIAVLALGAMVAILIHKHRKHQNDKLSKKEELATVVSSTIAILAATVLVGNLVIPVTKAASDETNSNSDEGTYLETEDKVTIVATIDKDSKESTIVTVKDTLYATTDASGYTVTMSMIEDALSANLYLNRDETSEYYIAPVENARLGDNTWGYRLNEEDEDYLPVPIADNPAIVAEGETAATHEEINVYYGLKVDGTLPLGTYSGEIEYNITPVNPIDKLTYMQDFAKLSAEEKTALIAAMPEGKQYTLIDYRGDDKSYYISKLADGKVWMTQNLDLDIDENTTYTHEDTDLGWSDPAHPDPTAKWKPDEGHSTIDFTDGELEGWVSSNTAPYSANPGNVYYYTSGNNDPDTFYDSQQACERFYTDGSCPHYHAGNYYNWSVAVASNNTEGMDTPYENAPDSICPAGWRLPKGPNTSDIYYSDMANLIQSYDILEDNIHEGCGGMCNIYSYLSDGFKTIRISPLWLVRPGCVGSSKLDDVGTYGRYWSNTVYDEGYVYQTYFLKTGVGPSNRYSRYSGFSVRCLVD